MTIIKCRECGAKFGQKWRLLRHYSEEHGGEIETPEEHLPDDDSEQRDFTGEAPSSDDYEPEYLVEDEEDGDNEESAEARRTSLREYAEDTEGGEDG